MLAFTLGEWKIQGGGCEFKSDLLFFFSLHSLRHIIQALWLHYLNVSHPICSCLEKKKTLHLPNACQIISSLSLCSDVMNTQ